MLDLHLPTILVRVKKPTATFQTSPTTPISLERSPEKKTSLIGGL